MGNDVYEVTEIQVLEGLESIRKRPGMYVGDLRDGSGLHHMVWEVVGNVIDLHLAGKATELTVDVRDGWVEVQDDGPGFPVARSRGAESAIEMILTSLHCGATYDGHFPHVHVGGALHGVGLAAVNALSTELEIETRTRGRVYRLLYRRGEPVEPLADVGRSETTGTRIRFLPDPEIFSGPGLDTARIRNRLEELAFLNPLMTIRFDRERIREREGITAMVWKLAAARGADPSLAVRRVTAAHDGVQVDVALTWLEEGRPELHGFVSQARAVEGTHVAGFWDALRVGLGSLRPREMTPRVFDEVLGRGLIAVVHVGLYDPQFGAPTKERLCSPEARVAVREVLSDALRRWCRAEPSLERELHGRLEP